MVADGPSVRLSRRGSGGVRRSAADREDSGTDSELRFG